jgi:hypothetical protein
MRRTLEKTEEISWAGGLSFQQTENSKKRTDSWQERQDLVQKCHARLPLLMAKKAISLNPIWLPQFATSLQGLGTKQ